MITYLQGDATDPQGPGNKIIAHICNDVGGWGRGFVVSLSRRWPLAETHYRDWYRLQGGEQWPPFQLGSTLFVPVAAADNPPDGAQIWVANMIAQHGVRRGRNGTPPIRYDALERCLQEVERFSKDRGDLSVHMPRIGCGLAGGNWNEVEAIIHRALPSTEVFVYDFDGH